MPNPRVKRGNPPTKIRRKYVREDSLDCLLRDFERRCAYCLTHSRFVSGDESFQVDHFHPTSKGGSKTNYDNLFLSCVRCNGNKSDEWPKRDAFKGGIRFLNCCLEMDYGDQIFEDEKGFVVPTTKAAEYHIVTINLNRPDLVRARLERRRLVTGLRERGVRASIKFGTSDVESLLAKLDELKDLISDLIPEIPLPDMGG